MTTSRALPAFSAYGIELEYMIVGRSTLAVRPIADELLRRMAGHDTADVTHGHLGWSNELVLHVLDASSPLREGRLAGQLDGRLEAYRQHTGKIPAIVRDVIPEPVATRADYEAYILEPIYRAIAAYDETGVLRHEWLNARGAIARFARNAIEIRLPDTQECPTADIAIACAVAGAVKALYQDRWSRLKIRDAFPTAALSTL